MPKQYRVNLFVEFRVPIIVTLDDEQAERLGPENALNAAVKAFERMPAGAKKARAEDTEADPHEAIVDELEADGRTYKEQARHFRCKAEIDAWTYEEDSEP